MAAPAGPGLDVRATGLRLIARGYALCPIAPGSKGPRQKGWNTAAQWLDSPAKLDAALAAHPTMGLGLIHGARTVALDVDDLPAAKAWCAARGVNLTALLATGARIIGNPARAKALYRAPDGLTLPYHKVEANGQTILELRSGPRQDVLPPSVHPTTGKPYRWDGFDLAAHDFPPMPEALVALWLDCTTATPSPASTRTGRTPSAIAAYNAAHSVADLLAAHGYTAEGGRYRPPGATGAAGIVLLNDGARCFSHHAGDPLANGHALDAFDVMCCLDHGGDTKAALRAVAPSAGVASDLDARLAAMNAEFAVVMMGGKEAIMVERADPIHGVRLEFWTFTAFTRWHEHHMVDVPLGEDRVARRAIADVWRRWTGRRQFRGVEFAPGRAARDGTYNLWQGFAVAPGPGRCDRFLAHLRDTIANGDEALYRYLLGWFAALIQRPGQKVETSLVIRGPQGCGKTLIGQVVGRLLGPQHYVPVAADRFVTGHFNAHLAQCLLLQVDEGFWAGDKASVGALKNLITAHQHAIEFKGKDALWLDNHVRLFITSNNRWVVPAGVSERRFAVLDAGDGRVPERAYFAALFEELDTQNGYAALHQALLDFDLSSVDLRQLPRTSAFAEQKAASLAPELKWWLGVLTDGILPGSTTRAHSAPQPALYDHYCDAAGQTGERHRLSKTELLHFLRECCPTLDVKHAKYQRRGESQVKSCRRYDVADLAACRERFERMTGLLPDWSRDDQWAREGDDPATPDHGAL